MIKPSLKRALKFGLLAIFACVSCLVTNSLISPSQADTPEWVARSNEFAQALDQALAAEACQEELTFSKSLWELDPKFPDFRACRQRKIRSVWQSLTQQKSQTENLALRLDLDILSKYAQQQLQQEQLEQKYLIPYLNLSQAILEDLKAIAKATPQSDTKRAKIQARLQQYVGISGTALTTRLQTKIQAQLHCSELAPPNPEQLKNDLQQDAAQIYKIESFLQRQQIPNYQSAYNQLKQQLFDYETFLRRKVLPYSQNNFRVPPELYHFRLAQQGIDIPVARLIKQAHTVFEQTKQEMTELAAQVAQEQGLVENNYLDVVAHLKKEVLTGQQTLELYRQRSQQLTKIIKREQIVSLPSRRFQIRLATADENKNFPVPLYEDFSGTFVIPVLRDRQKAKLYNDFTNPAMAWTLTVHEGRPGHDLQFATFQELKLSQARTEFSWNPTAVEGWATYAEKIMQPYMPPEGKLMSLQFELLRAARAFLEPELQLGLITPEAALKVITDETGFSEFFARQEIKRYTRTFVGHSPSYFYGAQQFWQLRSRQEQQLGKDFQLKHFHNQVLAQGILTPRLLQKILDSPSEE